MTDKGEASVVRVHNVLLATFPTNPTDRTIENLQESVLERMEEESPKGVILDLSGIEAVDSFIARTISETAGMVSLMGGQAILVGIPPTVAITAAELGYDLGDVEKARDTDQAFEYLGIETNTT